jgi:hypothetical protein
MPELFGGELGLMISALFIFAGMSDFMIITLFLSRQKPRIRTSDGILSAAEKVQFDLRVKRYKMLQFALAMSGFLMVAVGLYGITLQIIGAMQ